MSQVYEPAAGLRRGFQPFSSVGWKLLAPYLLLTAFFAVLGTFLVTRLVTGSLTERFENQLLETSRSAADSVVRAERRQLESVRAISFANGLGMALEEGDAVELERIVIPFAANNHVERVEILDENGNRVFGARLSPSASGYETTSLSADRAGWAAVAPVLASRLDPAGDKFAALTADADEWALFTSAPIFIGDRFAGVVLVGTPVRSILATAKVEALADVTLFAADGSLIGTTFPEATVNGPVLIPTNEFASTTGRSPERVGVSLYGRDYEVLYSEMRLRGQPVGQFAVALPSDYIASAGSTARSQMVLLFTGISVAVLLLGWSLARALTKPIQQLVNTTQLVTGGDLTARTGIARRDEIGDLARSFDAMTEKLQRQQLSTISALTSAIDARDPYTAGHSMRVGKLSAELGRALGLSAAQLQYLEVGGYLHDIGKIGVRDSVLLKEGALDARERELIERHPQIGLEILKGVDLPSEVIALVGGHHERLDGSGYPLRLKGDDVIIFPRVAAVADMYDALTTQRPYRSALSVEEALSLLQREALAGRIDPEVLQVLRYVAPQWEQRRRDDPQLEGYRLEERLFAAKVG